MPDPASPSISVIIPTYNRAPLLRSSLASLAAQTLPPDQYEVVVVNDGSTDATADVCREFQDRLPLRDFSIANSGISAAKNLGVFASRAPVLLFFDDDDVATPTLLHEHLKAHREHPQENIAVLGYTCWAPGMSVTPVMEYVTDVGQCLFSYKSLRYGQRLDYTYFWGGRSSCKRSLLVAHGVFNQDFRSIIEDIELGYRLSKFQLTVVFNRNAVSHMIRPITYDAFCARCERVGEALHLFGRLHPDPAVHKYCQVAEAKGCWPEWKQRMGMGFYRVRELEALLDSGPDATEAESLFSELRHLYRWTFACFKAKGILQAEARDADDAAGKADENHPHVIRPVVVYQMGKVGSKTIEASLKASDLGVPVCHSHLLNDLDRIERDIKSARVNPAQTLVEINHGKQLRQTLLGTSYVRCQVISLVRDPIARNLSAFFESITEFIPDFYERHVSGPVQLEELTSVFLTHYDHDTPLRWFDLQLKPVFGIDVFATEFPKEPGYAVYEGPSASLLLIKLEKLKECAGAAMRGFLGIEKFVLSNANTAEGKEYRDVYRAFLDAVQLPGEYLERMYESKLARHFYSGEEIGGFIRQWAKHTRRRPSRIQPEKRPDPGRVAG